MNKIFPGIRASHTSESKDDDEDDVQYTDDQSTDAAQNPANVTANNGPNLETDNHNIAPTLAHCTARDELTTTQSLRQTEETEQSSQSTETPDNNCVICMDTFKTPKTLDKCGHIFCTECIDQYFEKVKPQCPCCFAIYGVIRGNQPKLAEMFHIVTQHRLPGYESTSEGSIEIYYVIPDGIQDERHPHPGKPYCGTTRRAFLPYNDEGREILELLKRAFALDLIFTIGESRVTGAEDVVTWNDIHHKTNHHGGPQRYGYPDSTYLNR